MPLIVRARIAAATVSASSGRAGQLHAAGLAPSADEDLGLDRRPGRRRPPGTARRPARASAGVRATSQRGTGSPWASEQGLGVGFLDLHAGLRAASVGGSGSSMVPAALADGPVEACGRPAAGAGRADRATGGAGSAAEVAARLECGHRPSDPGPRSPALTWEAAAHAWRSRERARRSDGRRSSRPGPPPRASGRTVADATAGSSLPTAVALGFGGVHPLFAVLGLPLGPAVRRRRTRPTATSRRSSRR